MLRHLYAYAVVAQKGSDHPAAPSGGHVGLTGPLGLVVQEATNQAPTSSWIDVRFDIDAGTANREHPVRAAAVTLAFGSNDDAAAAAAGLALRLSKIMDRRMKGCLLAVAIEELEGGRQVTLWTFPRDEALRFVGGGEPEVEVLQDAFSRRSNLRKAAVIRGADDGTTSFLSARAADLQTGGRGETADYWIHDFLAAHLSLAAGAGSRALARALKSAWEDAPEDERDQYYSAAIAVRASTATRTSLSLFAEQYLRGTARARFLQTKDAREHRSRQFQFSRDAFDDVANFRVVRTDNGLRISAPFASADDVLEFEVEGNRRLVTARGNVVDDRVSARA